MATQARPLAMVTGASTEIGYELAKRCAEQGFNLVIAAGEPKIHDAARNLAQLGASVEAVHADLGTFAGVGRLYAAAGGRAVDALFANVGHGIDRPFLDQDVQDVRRIIDTNVTGTLQLLHLVGRDMRARGRGRILIAATIAGLMPGRYQAVHCGVRALLDSFAFALRHELRGSGVTVTCMMPGPTETEFVERGDASAARAAETREDPAEITRLGFDAMMRGEGDVVTGWRNKLGAEIAGRASAGRSEAHRTMTSRHTGCDGAK
jgi:uncharacterized protein